MTIKQRIIQYLQNHPEGVDDDELAKALDLEYRQQASSRCRELEREGLVIRRQVEGKIHNFWAEGAVHSTLPASLLNEQRSQRPLSKSEHWFWEGNVQAKVISFLAAQGFQIRSAADTASHQQGIDIVAEKSGKTLWVTVKGYPQGTDKTNPTVQAGHWFKQAIFDIIEYRERDKKVALAVALPDYRRYRSMAQKITWFKASANFVYFWVRENGDVSVE